MNYLGPIHCRNCRTVADTSKPLCHCNEGGNSGSGPNFVPYIKEPHDFIALQRDRIAKLEAALKLARDLVEDIAKQPLNSELPEDEGNCEDGYNTCVEISRTALTKIDEALK